MTDTTNKRKALVVDDDPGIRVAVSLKLRMSGFDVDEASDGVEALEYLENNTVDIIIADVGMPRMDGYTLSQRVHGDKRTEDLPLIILTAQDMEVPVYVKRNLRKHRFMMKPFSPRELIKTANELLGEEES